MAIQPTQPQGIGGVLDTTFQLYKSSLGGVWPLCLLLSLAGAPTSIYVALTGSASSLTDPMAVFSMMADPIYWLAYLIGLALMMAVAGALYVKQRAIAVDEELSIGAALQAGFGRVLPLVVAVLLYILAIGVGSVLLLVPGLILMVSLVLCVGLVMFEDKGPVASLTASHKLVWGNWWRTMAILTVGGLLVFVVYLAVGLVLGLILPFVGLGVNDIVTYSMVSSLLIGVLVNIVVTPFFSAMLIALYWDLKLRKEGGDLAARVGALNAA